MLTFCTIATAARRAHCRVLADSLRIHHPGARLVAAGPPQLFGGADEAWEHADLDRLTIPDLLSEALRECDTAIYVDSSVRLYRPLESVVAALTAHPIALLRRVQALPDDGGRPDDGDLLAAGEITPAVVAVRAGVETASLLDWWARRASHGDQPDGRWLALAATRFGSIGIVEDPGCAVSYWNLHERQLEEDRDEVTAAGSPLRCVDWDGFRPDRPYWLSDATTRVRVVDSPVLSTLCGEHAEDLLMAGWEPHRRGIEALPRLGNGQRIDHLVRALWQEAMEAGAAFSDPLEQNDSDAFVRWMREPAARGGAAGVNRYLYAAYLTRPDLQREFPDLDGLDAARLIGWAKDHGRLEVFSELLPDPARDRRQLGVNVIGYLGETLGLAEAARLYVKGLIAAGVPVSTTTVTPDLPIADVQRSVTRYGSHGYVDLRAATDPTFNLVCLNGDHLAELVRVRGPEVLEGRPTIGQWGWETDVLPPSWTPAFSLVQEVWVYSRFVAENLGRLVPVPVVVVPPAIVAPEPAGRLPIADDERFTFVCMLDFFSTLPRKNPLGLVDAFTRAFGLDEGPRLIIKTINARFRPQAADELRFRAGGRRDIIFYDEYLEPGEKALLLQRADCYVSLHRSEGFGLPLGEAMALGTPVIATGYSGNTDFMSAQNSYLVDFSPVPVGLGVEIYPPDGTWAEPDLDDAARLMRHVFEHPEEAAKRGARGRADVARAFSPEAVGGIARARLESLLDHSARGRPNESGAVSEALDRLEAVLRGFDLRRGMGAGSGGAAGVARRAALRAMLPFTFHERQVDRSLTDAVRALAGELHDERERSARARSRLQRLERAIRDSPDGEAAELH